MAEAVSPVFMVDPSFRLHVGMCPFPDAVQSKRSRVFLNGRRVRHGVPDKIRPHPPGMGAARHAAYRSIMRLRPAPRGHAPPKGLTELPNREGKGFGGHAGMRFSRERAICQPFIDFRVELREPFSDYDLWGGNPPTCPHPVGDAQVPPPACEREHMPKPMHQSCPHAYAHIANASTYLTLIDIRHVIRPSVATAWHDSCLCRLTNGVWLA